MENIGSLLLPWYDRFRRDLPWRGSQDPYAVWVSETMLQQTALETQQMLMQRLTEREQQEFDPLLGVILTHMAALRRGSI